MKRQVLANLANFSYDPINYQFLRRLKVIDLFLGKYLTSSIIKTYLVFYIIAKLSCLEFVHKCKTVEM